MNKINLQVWSTFRLYGKICENCSGAMALCLLQALAMLGCLSNRGVGGAYYWLLTFIAVLATVGFLGSLISIGNTIYFYTRDRKIAKTTLYTKIRQGWCLPQRPEN
ncbi:hypothetical protein [Klebsiella variicola]|uniref:hypothetical protein n=1 Tax=Klebsiella variicola TaxID=244366 RepID=UPI00227B1CA9|nr:hypothetical protein [Klebsiella variicola]